MKLEDNTVLLTGGSAGIGLALAERFVAAGSEVILVGRRESALAEAKKKLPKAHTRVADVGRVEDRVALAAWVVKEFPRLNVLFNNAGIQRFPKLTEAPAWDAIREELAIDLDAPIHLATLLFPHLAKQPRAAIVNTTSGLAYVPLPVAPIYSSAKAGLAAFTTTLRTHATSTSVEVIEFSPPHVETDLGVPGGNKAGMPLAEFIDKAVAELVAGAPVVTVGFSKAAYNGTRAERDGFYQRFVDAAH